MRHRMAFFCFEAEKDPQALALYNLWKRKWCFGNWFLPYCCTSSKNV